MPDWKPAEPIHNFIAGREVPARSGRTFDNLNPHTGKPLGAVAASNAQDIADAVAAAKAAQPAWAATPAVQRGMLLFELVKAMQANADQLGEIVATETGKSLKASKGEVGGAAQCGLFFAGEGQRLFGRTMTSGTPNKTAMTVRTVSL